MFDPIILSLRVACVAVCIDFIFAMAIARFMARGEFTGKNLAESLMILPMVLPPTVLGYGLLIFFGKRGPLGHILLEYFGFQIIFTYWAAVLASAIVSFPLMYQSAKAAFSNMDLSLENAARTLGTGEMRIFFTITLPLAWPGILAGLVLSFARALGEFGATLMVAGNIPGKTQTLPLAIYSAVESGDTELAQRLVIVITVLSFAALYWLNRGSKETIQIWKKGSDAHAES
jgi:molybdate transport system permease protein